jgi:hypothetical protein
LLVYLVWKVPFSRMLMMFEPGLGYWLTAVAAVLFIKGVIEITLMSRVSRQTYAR